MSSIGKTLKGYVWWTYPRGSFHYDVMVSLILLFIFLGPLFINFNDKPAERHQRVGPAGVSVVPDGKGGFQYRIDAEAVRGKTDAEIRDDLLGVIEPIAGEVVLERYEVVTDSNGKVVGYEVWVRRGMGG